MFFASSFLIIPKKKLNENNRQKKARNEFIIRLHIFIRDFEIQAKILFHFFNYMISDILPEYSIKQTKKDILLKDHHHKKLTKRYFIRFIFVLFCFDLKILYDHLTQERHLVRQENRRAFL